MKMPRAHWTKAMLKCSEGNTTPPHIFMSGMWDSWWCHLSPMGFGGPIHVACYLQHPRPLFCVDFPESFLARLISWLMSLHCNLAFPFRDSQIGLSEPPNGDSNTVLTGISLSDTRTCVSAKFHSTVSPAARLRYNGVHLHHNYNSLWSVSIAKPGKTFV